MAETARKFQRTDSPTLGSDPLRSPVDWPMGIVKKVTTDKHGTVRTYSILVNNGICTCPYHSIVPLPPEQEAVQPEEC